MRVGGEGASAFMMRRAGLKMMRTPPPQPLLVEAGCQWPVGNAYAPLPPKITLPSPTLVTWARSSWAWQRASRSCVASSICCHTAANLTFRDASLLSERIMPGTWVGKGCEGKGANGA